MFDNSEVAGFHMRITPAHCTVGVEEHVPKVTQLVKDPHDSESKLKIFPYLYIAYTEYSCLLQWRLALSTWIEKLSIYFLRQNCFIDWAEST